MKAITLWSDKEVKSQAEISKKAEEKEEDQYVMVKDVPKEEKVEDPTEPKKAWDSTPLTYAPKIPFPQRLKKHKDKEQFSKFLEIFKKLQINIPLAEAHIQMLNYAKFLKDLITEAQMGWSWDNTLNRDM